jgi:hypothetical protein
MNTNRPSNKCTNFVSALIVLIIPFPLFCRNQVLFDLKDSTTIHLENTIFYNNTPQISKIVLVNDKLIFTEMDKKSVNIFDIRTNTLKIFKPEILGNKVMFFDNFDVTETDIFVVSKSLMKIYQINHAGELISSFSLSKKHLKYMDMRSFSYSNTLKRFYLLNSRLFNEKYLNKRRQKSINFFSKKDLIIEIDSFFKSSNFFGFYDSLYLKNIIPHSYRTSFVTDQKNVLLFSQNLSHSIYYVNLDNNNSKNLNFPGKYITLRDIEIPVSIMPYTRNEDYYNHLIRSFHYFDLVILNNINLCFRVYTDAALDTTESLVSEDNSLNKKKLCVQPSERLLAQKDILVKKPKYVQIIDYHNNQLIFDGTFPFKGTFFLSSRSKTANAFHTFQWNKDKIVIYHYSISN